MRTLSFSCSTCSAALTAAALTCAVRWPSASLSARGGWVHARVAGSARPSSRSCVAAELRKQLGRTFAELGRLGLQRLQGGRLRVEDQLEL